MNDEEVNLTQFFTDRVEELKQIVFKIDARIILERDEEKLPGMRSIREMTVKTLELNMQLLELSKAGEI